MDPLIRDFSAGRQFVSIIGKTIRTDRPAARRGRRPPIGDPWIPVKTH
jgi:hypothetical protein